METSGRPIFKIPIILLALANLAILGTRLWPWQDAMNLPGNGTTALDPAISLAAYVGLVFWIGSARADSSRKSLFSSAMLGILAGMFLIAQVVVAARQANAENAGPDKIQIGLLACAAVVLGMVGLRAAKSGNTTGFSTVCAIWASMVGCLMAVAAVLSQGYFSGGASESADPWKQYEGLAIGTPAIQSLVHSLDTISGFLLLGPLVGCIAGAAFASFGNPKKA
jgi:hypothetical protein